MISLSLELSSDRASLALLEGDTTIGTCNWHQARVPGRRTFTELSSLLDRAGIEPSRIESFFIGRGPGTFSALRIANSAARAFALPGGGTVYSVSSGAAIAREARQTPGMEGPIAVVGDARRNSVWIGTFEEEDEITSNRNVWRVLPAESFPGAVPDGTTFVTPQWERLQSILPEDLFAAYRWKPSPCYPDAVYVARVAEQRIRRGLPSEPLEPLYLHPPVSTPPPGPA